jgi:hypothetical protein
MKKIFLASFLFVAVISLNAQTYTSAVIEKTDKDGMQYEILGKINNHIWVYKKNGDLSTIAQYNEQMQLVKQNDLSFLPANVRSLEFVVGKQNVYAVFQFFNQTTGYIVAAAIDQQGQLVGSPKMLDSAQNVRPGTYAKIFNLIESENKQHLAVFRVNTTKTNHIKVHVNRFDEGFENAAETEISINSNDKKSQLSDFALDNQGNLYCLRNTTIQEAAPSVSLLFLSADGKNVKESSIINNQLLLDDIRLKVDNSLQRVILNSLYATEKKGHVEGLFTYVWDVKSNNTVLTTATRFTDASRASVSNKRNLKDAFDSYYLDKVKTMADGSYVVIAESAETYSNRSAFSRWDYYWGGPLYNPFYFNAWYRPFGFYPWARYGWGPSFGWNPWMSPFARWGYPSVTYNANQIALMSMDAKGNLQWVKTIDKSQSDINVDQFIGYGSFENNKGLQFVYYQKQKGQRQFVLHTLSNDNHVEKSAIIPIAEKNYEWMPKYLKQVGENEVVVPYQHKEKIGFALIKLK